MPLPSAILAALPAPCEAVIETHISWVLLAGDFAFKVKKPVVLPFLDYGSREKRLFYCQEELRLNRRFSPELYLEVVDLAGEPAVKMRRFPDEMRLDRVCRRHALPVASLLAFARRLAAFEDAMPPASPASPFGTPEVVMTAARENFAELSRLLPAGADRLERLAAWSESEGARLSASFLRRKRAGRVREGHGDLHLANLVLLDERIVPFDAIEFREDFRILDVASEIAFLLLDLVDHGEPGLASLFLSEWLVWSGDFDALSVLRFYLVYRAMVRAKVAALQGKRDECEGYLGLAERFAVFPQPTLTITFGPSGCGKTFVSGQRLQDATWLTTVRVRSDVERKRLYGLTPDAASGGTIYTPAANLRTYAHLAEIAEAALSFGWSVIVDAAFLRRRERETFRRLAERLGVPFAILAPSASQEEMVRRLESRRGDASEATAEVLARQLANLEPLTSEEQRFMA